MTIRWPHPEPKYPVLLVAVVPAPPVGCPRCGQYHWNADEKATCSRREDA